MANLLHLAAGAGGAAAAAVGFAHQAASLGAGLLRGAGKAATFTPFTKSKRIPMFGPTTRVFRGQTKHYPLQFSAAVQNRVVGFGLLGGAAIGAASAANNDYKNYQYGVDGRGMPEVERSDAMGATGDLTLAMHRIHR